jgi:hypothetical protein
MGGGFLLAKRISVDQAVAGQVLAEQIARHDGVLLASQGSLVSEGLIRTLIRQNVDTIAIEEEEKRSDAEIMGVHDREIERVDAAFARIPEESVLIALRKTLVYLADKERDKALEYLAALEAKEAKEAEEALAAKEAEEAREAADAENGSEAEAAPPARASRRKKK